MHKYEIGEKQWVLGDLIENTKWATVCRCHSAITDQRGVAKLFVKESDECYYRWEIDIYRKITGKHPAIPIIFEYGEDEQYCYIIMEEITGGELLELINQTSPRRLPEKDVFNIFYQLVDVIEFLHNKNIFHHDIKPENILLTGDKKRTIKLIDFGFSRESAQSMLVTTKCGTHTYAAPEIFKVEPHSGFKNDIWGIGVILYCLAAGFNPFATDEKEMYQPQRMSDELYDLVLNICVEDPNKRYSLAQIKSSKWYQQYLKSE